MSPSYQNRCINEWARDNIAKIVRTDEFFCEI